MSTKNEDLGGSDAKSSSSSCDTLRALEAGERILAMGRVATFFVLVIWLLALKGPTPYWINHTNVAFLLFLLGAAIHFVFASKLQWLNGSFLSGFLCGMPFYISREIRDREKLGFWDIPGLVAPTVGLIVLYVAMECITRYWSRKQSTESKMTMALEFASPTDVNAGQDQVQRTEDKL